MINYEDADVMTTKEAIKHVVDVFGIRSMYELAKQLSDDKLNVQAIQISNYVRGLHKMSGEVADRFFNVYGIIISDAHRPGVFQR